MSLFGLSATALGFLFVLHPIFSSTANDSPNLQSHSEKTLNIKDLINYDISEQFYFIQEGRSSWYGKRFHLRRTASGEKFDMHSFTVAHRFLPFETIVRITNKSNGQKILARVTDRGPYVNSKVIDLSYRIAKEIDGFGNPEVTIEALIPNDDINIDFSDNYYFGFSYDYPLVCLPIDKFTIIAEFYHFDQAQEFYSNIAKLYSENYPYLLVAANQTKNYIQRSKTRKYYVAFLTNKKQFQPYFVKDWNQISNFINY